MRKIKSIYNILGSLGSYFVTMIFTFITQGMIIKILGIEYSGVNGLFSNILTMLSAAELGLSTTIIFKLYEPIASNNKEKIKSWLNFYKVCYRYVALFVLILGIFMIPFIPMIVGHTSINDNIIILYLISLLDTVISYVMTYKRSLLYADQKNYIINFIHIGYVILMNVMQIIVLYITKNYYYFLFIKLLYRLLENIIINVYVNKNYPYVKEDFIEIDCNEKKDFFSRIRAMLLQKISFVINKGIDNIIISVFLGVAFVGYYTNYHIVITALCGIIFEMISGFGASVGDLLTEKNTEKNYLIYKKINFVNTFITSICITGFLCCIKPFIKLWLGTEYILSTSIVASFCLYLYSDSIRRSITIFKEAAGICKEDQLMYIIMALINLVSSIILCKIIGMSGVIIGTAMSYLFLIFYSYPKYIFEKIFGRKKIEYYKITLKNIILIFVAALFGYYIAEISIANSDLINFIKNGIISVITTVVIYLIGNINTDELKYFVNLLKIKNKV